MEDLVCPECNGLLLPADEGRCPICRRDVPRPGAAVPARLLDEPGEAGEEFGPGEEALYQQARALVQAPGAWAARRPGWMGLMLLAYAVFLRADRGWRAAAILLAVVVVHELGHLLGMKLFGYRDVRMFFIPFFGGAVSGRSAGAPRWQEAIVLLLGPLPGIVVGVALAAWNLRRPDPLVHELALWLVIVNGFNLLPLEPLDGGRFLNAVVFSRHRLLEALYLAATSTAVLALCVLTHAYVLGLLGVLGLIGTPNRYRIAGAARAIRRRWSPLPADLAHAGDPLLRELFAAARFLGRAGRDVAGRYALVMGQIHERARARPVPLLAALGLLGLYAAGLLGSFVALGAILG